MKKSKKIKPNCVWSIDLFHKEADGPSKIPFYEIWLTERDFAVMYHGCCKIKSCKTFEEARSWVFDEIRRHEND